MPLALRLTGSSSTTPSTPFCTRQWHSTHSMTARTHMSGGHRLTTRLLQLIATGTSACSTATSRGVRRHPAAQILAGEWATCSAILLLVAATTNTCTHTPAGICTTGECTSLIRATGLVMVYMCCFTGLGQNAPAGCPLASCPHTAYAGGRITGTPITQHTAAQPSIQRTPHDASTALPAWCRRRG